MISLWAIFDWKDRRPKAVVRTQALANAVVARLIKRTGVPVGVMAVPDAPELEVGVIAVILSRP